MQDHPTQIALVSPGWPPGQPPNGVVTYTAHLRAALADAGTSAHVLSWRTPAGATESAIHGIGEDRYQRTIADRVIDRLRFRLSVAQKVDRHRQRLLRGAVDRLRRHQAIDLIEVPDSFGASLGLDDLPLPVVVRLHGPWFLVGPQMGEAADRDFAWRVAMEGRALARADAITAPSQDLLERTRAYYDLPLEQAVVIANPLDPAHAEAPWRLEAADSQRILFVGRFDRNKGGDVAVAAFARIAEKHPLAMLTMAGPDQGFLDDAGRRHGLESYLRDHLPADVRSQVEVLGPQSPEQVKQLRTKALVTIVPSRYENFPYTVLEAMGAGCPVVASRTGGIPEMIVDQDNGLLFPVGQAEALAEAVGALLRAPNRAAALGQKAAEDARRQYGSHTIARQTMDLYTDTWRRKKKRSDPQATSHTGS